MNLSPNWFLAAIVTASSAQAQVISTVAGGGFGDGTPAVLALVGRPTAVAADAAGNVYVVDASQRVRRVDARSGIITPFAGGGSALGDGGPAAGAALRATGIAFDRQGHLHISDALNSRIRKVDAATGIITTMASLPGPSGDLAIDASGNVYVAQGSFTNPTVQRVSATGMITTVAGGGTAVQSDGRPATSAQLGLIVGIAIDSKGNLHVSESGRIRRIDAVTGLITTLASGLSSFASITFDPRDNLYIADDSSHRVRMIDASSGSMTTVAGTGSRDRPGCTLFCADGYFAGDGGHAEQAGLDSPSAVAVDARGNLYIADSDNDRVRRVDAETRIITTVAGTFTDSPGDGGLATNAGLYLPTALAVEPNGDFYVISGFLVKKVTAGTGTIATVAGSGNPNFSGDGGPAVAAGVDPRSLTLDAAGNLYIAGSGRVRKVSALTGIITTVAGSGDLGDSFGIAFDRTGNLYVAESSYNRIRRVAAGTGAITTIAGTGTAASTGDGGPATNASLNQPTALVSDGVNLYVIDWRGRGIRKIDLATNIITTVARAGGDIRGGLALDARGNLYVAEYEAIRRIEAGTGAITLVAGGRRGFAGDGGPAASASLDTATGIGLDGQGNLYFADMINRRVRKVSAHADNFQGLWWKSPGGSESGWGVNLAHQGDILFATWFTYDADGSGLWLVMSNGTRVFGSTYAGPLYRTTGPAFDAGAWDPAQVRATLVGSAHFTFANASNGAFSYTVNGSAQTKAIERQVFASPTPTCVAGGVPGATPNYQGLWWRAPAGSESGWGVNVTHQGDTLFATWFTYETGGKGQWLVMSNGARTGPGRYTGPLYRTRGPAFDAVPWPASQVNLTQVGTATFAFDGADAGTFSYVVDGISQSKPITRQAFSTTPTVCN